MKTLIVGASGATGNHLVNQLLDRKQEVKIVVRSVENLPVAWKNNSNLEIIEASILDLSDEEIKNLTADCQSIASCLGHNMNFKGVFGKPRQLVSDATQRLCEAVISNNSKNKVKFVLLNTSGNRNKDLNEQVSFPEKILVGLLKIILPPHADNENAAEFLRTKIGQNNPSVEWTAVRPDNLINEDSVSKYETHPSPIRSAIFNAGKVSRNNVGHFMASLITNNDLWEKWKGKMPLIYNVETKRTKQN